MDAGFDFIDIDPEFEIHLDSDFRVGLFGLGVVFLTEVFNPRCELLTPKELCNLAQGLRANARWVIETLFLFYPERVLELESLRATNLDTFGRL